MKKNINSWIDFSGQFGGRDAGAIAMGHWKALKSAAKGIAFEGFPFPELTFILRVDGEVHQFGFSGPANVDVDRAGQYISVDIGITEADRGDMQNKIIEALLAAPATIASATAKRNKPELDTGVLELPLARLIERYEEIMRVGQDQQI